MSRYIEKIERIYLRRREREELRAGEICRVSGGRNVERRERKKNRSREREEMLD